MPPRGGCLCRGRRAAAGGGAAATTTGVPRRPRMLGTSSGLPVWMHAPWRGANAAGFSGGEVRPPRSLRSPARWRPPPLVPRRACHTNGSTSQRRHWAARHGRWQVQQRVPTAQAGGTPETGKGPGEYNATIVFVRLFNGHLYGILSHVTFKSFGPVCATPLHLCSSTAALAVSPPTQLPASAAIGAASRLQAPWGAAHALSVATLSEGTRLTTACARSVDSSTQFAPRAPLSHSASGVLARISPCRCPRAHRERRTL